MTTHHTSPGGDTAEEAKRKLEGASETLRADAASAKDEAVARAESEAERQKEMGAGHLDAFADAVRKAADELGEHDESAAAQFVRQAAGGLENLSGSLRQKSVGDLVDSVSRFGRSNPTAFLGGALLAGVALGRFAQASSEHSHASGGTGARGGASRSRDWSAPGSSDINRPVGGASSGSSGVGGSAGGPSAGSTASTGAASVGSAAAAGSAGGTSAGSTGSSGSTGAAARPFPSTVKTGGSDDATR